MKYSKKGHVNKHFNKLIKFDNIRIQKILEIMQYMIISMIIASYSGYKIDKYLGEYDKNMSTYDLFINVSIQILFICISIIYIPKIVMIMPFLLHYTNDYKPCFHKECKIGIGITLSIGFKAIMVNFKIKIVELLKRLII